MQVVEIIVLSLACVGVAGASIHEKVDIDKLVGQWYSISMVSDMAAINQFLQMMISSHHFVSRYHNETHLVSARSNTMLKSGGCFNETEFLVVDGSFYQTFEKNATSVDRLFFGSNFTHKYKNIVYDRYALVEVHILMNNAEFKGLSLAARTPHVTKDVMEEFNKAVVQANLANEEKFVFENKVFCDDSKVHYEKTNCGKDPFSIDKYAGYWITIAISTDHPGMCKLLKKIQSSHYIVQRFAPLENAVIVKAKTLINNGSCIKSTMMIEITETSGKITPVNLTLPSDSMTIFTDLRYSCIDMEYENYGFLTVDGIAADKTPHKMIYLVARKHQVPESAMERLAEISIKFGISKERIVKFPNNEFCYEEEHVEKDQ